MYGTKLRIVADSSCDLSTGEADRLGVVMVPLAVCFGPEVFLAGELSHDEFWEKTKGPFWPTSSQPSVGAFEEAFAALVDEGCHVLCLTLTSHHSGTYNSAWAGAQRFGDSVTVVDSLSVSAGLAWQVIAAVEAAERGMALDDIVALSRSMSRRTRLVAVLDTIENVRKGGRVSKLMPLLGRLMKVFDLKPMLKMVDGELDLAGTPRSYEKALHRIEEQVVAVTPLEKMTVIHTRLPERAASFADILASAIGFPREEVSVLELGPVLASHAGPGVIGVLVLLQAVPDMGKPGEGAAGQGSDP
jgi:DegV family protein with EDD domain